MVDEISRVSFSRRSCGKIIKCCYIEQLNFFPLGKFDISKKGKFVSKEDSFSKRINELGLTCRGERFGESERLSDAGSLVRGSRDRL